jgi:pilin isopeptide linkage protein
MKYKKFAVSLGMVFLLFMGMFTFQVNASEQSADDNDADVTIEVTLQINGDIPDEEHIPFTFILDEEDGAPVPVSSSVTITGEGTAEFGEITFTKPGEYEYTVTEQNDGVENYVYDDTVYTLDVDVRYDEYGNLIATCVAYCDDQKEPAIMFINTYDDDIPVPDGSTPAEEQSSTSSNTETTSPSNESSTVASTSPSGEETSTTTNQSTETTVSTGNTQPSTSPTNSFTSPTPGTSKTSDSPKTGDNANVFVWLLLLFVGVLGMSVCLRYLIVSKSKKRNKKK